MARISARDAARLTRLTAQGRQGAQSASPAPAAALAEATARAAEKGQGKARGCRARRVTRVREPLSAVTAERHEDGSVVLEFNGVLKPKERARRRGDGGGMFTPDETREAHRFLANLGRLAMRGASPIEGPVMAEVFIRVAPPTSWSKRRKDAALAGDILPDVKPDSDNFIKTLYDGLNKCVYKDDAQICLKIVLKMYGVRDGVRAVFRPMKALGASQPLPRSLGAPIVQGS